jgi:hypothetical protein
MIGIWLIFSWRRDEWDGISCRNEEFASLFWLWCCIESVVLVTTNELEGGHVTNVDFVEHLRVFSVRPADIPAGHTRVC